MFPQSSCVKSVRVCSTDSLHSLFITWTGKAGSKKYKNAGKTFQNATFMSAMCRNLKSSVALMHTERKAEHGLNIGCNI